MLKLHAIPNVDVETAANIVSHDSTVTVIRHTSLNRFYIDFHVVIAELGLVGVGILCVYDANSIPRGTIFEESY